MRILRTILGGLAMFIVLVLAAGLTVRLALHAGEVPIPDFSGMTVSEASTAALHGNLDLNIADRYYSTTVPAGRILSQAPAAGSTVRKGWQVRVTESLGPQQVSIPNVVGEPEREASIDIHRSSLDLGTLAHLDAPGDPEIVLSQTPPPDAGVDQPRISLLLSATGGDPSSAFVMPSFVGMGYTSASHEAIALGLRVAAIGDIPQAPAPVAPVATVPGGPPAAASEPVSPPTPVGPVTAQSPESGHRAGKGMTVRLTFGHPASSTPAASSPGSATVSTAPSASQSAPAPPH